MTKQIVLKNMKKILQQDHFNHTYTARKLNVFVIIINWMKKSMKKLHKKMNPTILKNMQRISFHIIVMTNKKTLMDRDQNTITKILGTTKKTIMKLLIKIGDYLMLKMKWNNTYMKYGDLGL